ncbi:hypothetical protein CXF71_11545 [Colwellia sp. 12G3]|nr:hypothetical protein CXF71_11545 [Colwellia sp. 12G3]
MANNELFTDKIAKLKKPLAFLFLLFCLLFDFQLIKSIFWYGENKIVYLQNEFGFGSFSDISGFILINALIYFLIAYLLQKKK